jgi:hypothetical protein
VSTALIPLCYRQGDFFVADILDVVPKGDIASMEYPRLFGGIASDAAQRYIQYDICIEGQCHAYPIEVVPTQRGQVVSQQPQPGGADSCGV